MNKPRDTERRMLDIFLDKPARPREGGVQIQISPSPLGRTLWVNIDGVCRLRVGEITSDHTLEIDGEQFIRIPPEHA